jgi:hypothetical protein
MTLATIGFHQKPKNLFAPKENETVLAGIDNQINTLKKIYETHMGYLDILDVQQDEMLDDDSLTSYQVWALQQHCIVLCMALRTAKEKMNGVTWQQCCKEAIEYLAAMGMCLTYKVQTVMQWYRSFCFKWKFTRLPCKKTQLTSIPTAKS